MILTFLLLLAPPKELKPAPCGVTIYKIRHEEKMKKLKEWLQKQKTGARHGEAVIRP